MKPSSLTTFFKGEAPREVARLRDVSLPAADGAAARRRWRGAEIVGRARRYLGFLLVVVLPTLLASIYYLFVAADQYYSEARFLIRGQGTTPSMLGQMVTFGSLPHPIDEELLSVGDFMKSHYAVQQLEQRIHFSEFYRRPEVDWFARLPAKTSAEELLDYYTDMIGVSFDSMTGIGILRVRAFRPEDAAKIANTLLTLSEELVNRFSARQHEDTLRVAREEVQRAEERVKLAREQLTTFRAHESSIDPARSSTMVLELIAKLEEELAKSRTDMIAASSYLKPDNAKFALLRNQADAIERQITSEKQRLTGTDGSLAPVVARYERLQLEREFADKDYAASMDSLKLARVEALKQSFYLVRVVEPNLAEKALYPRRFIILTTLLVGLLMTYGIGWLIIAGVREHAA